MSSVWDAKRKCADDNRSMWVNIESKVVWEGKRTTEWKRWKERRFREN